MQVQNLLIWSCFPKLREGDAFKGCPGVLRLHGWALGWRGQVHAVVQHRQGTHPEVNLFAHAHLAQVYQGRSPARKGTETDISSGWPMWGPPGGLTSIREWMSLHRAGEHSGYLTREKPQGPLGTQKCQALNRPSCSPRANSQGHPSILHDSGRDRGSERLVIYKRSLVSELGLEHRSSGNSKSKYEATFCM